MTGIIAYIGLFLLLMLSAFFSGSEISLAHFNRIRVKSKADDGDKKSIALIKLTDDFNSMISTILVGNNLVNIAFSSVITFISVEIWFPGDRYTPMVESIITVIATLFILIFGEIFPKIIAAENADKFAPNLVMPMTFCKKLFYPIVKSTSVIMDKIQKLWTKPDEPTATAEELVTMVEEIEDEGVFTEKEGELIRSAIEFSDISAREIMIPRVDVIAFDIDSPIDELIGNKELLSFSRFPVYKDSIDNIVGILSTKKFIRAVLSGEKVNIEEIMYQPIFVHMTRTISSILEEFRKTHSQMAVVLDEYGGTMGILTLEDILEEIVGEIYDESDDVEEDFVKRGDKLEVDGGANIEDCFEELEFEDPDFESEYTTIGGWATEILDKLPEVGDEYNYKNLHVKILEADEKHVEKLLIEKTEEEETEE